MKNRSILKALKASLICGGAFNLIRDILVIFAVPGGNRTVQEGSKRWNARRLQPIIVILIAGFIVSGSPIPAYAAVGDVILEGVKISLSIAYTGGSWEHVKNVTLLKEGYTLALDRVYSENLSGRYIANFSIRKNGEVVETISANEEDIFYYNKTIDNIEYTIIESKVSGIFFGTETIVVLLEPFYQYSDGSITSEPESLASNITVLVGAAPSEQWNRTFGGKDRDDAYSVSQTSDGGYVTIGCIRSYDPYGDAWLIKTDANGNEQWSKTFGGKCEDVAYSGHQTRDGGYILIGKTGSYGMGYFDAWLIKTDTNGKEQWNRTFGGTEGNYAYADTACAGHQTRDGGYNTCG